LLVSIQCNVATKLVFVVQALRADIKDCSGVFVARWMDILSNQRSAK